MTNKVVGVGLGAALALCSAGAASAAQEEKPMSPQQQRVEFMKEVMADDSKKGSLKAFVTKYSPNLDLVAKLHPMPQKQYTGTTLRQKADAAQAAIARIGMLIEETRPRTTKGDKPLEYVVDAGNRVLDKLSKGFNAHLIPAGAELDKAEEYVTEAAGSLYVIAEINGQDGKRGCPRAKAAGGPALFASKIMVAFVGTTGKPAWSQCGNPSATQQELESQFDPIVAQVGRGIVVLTNEELPLVAMVLNYIDLAGKSSTKAMGLAKGIFATLQEAEAIKNELAERSGAYAQGMKGSAAQAAKASAEHIEVAINALGDYAAALHEIGGKGDALINGPVKNAYEKVYDCSLENIRVGQYLQTDAPDADRAAAVRVAKAKNVAAVAAVEGVSVPYQMWVGEKGGRLELSGLPETKSAGLSAVREGQSPTVDTVTAVKKGARDAMSLTCGAGEKC